MMIKLMIVWMVSIITLSIVIGELLLRKSNSITIRSKKAFNEKYLVDTYDTDFDILKLENIEIVSTQALQKRGSWRMAQDRIMSHRKFTELRDAEYNKRLY